VFQTFGACAASVITPWPEDQGICRTLPLSRTESLRRRCHAGRQAICPGRRFHQHLREFRIVGIGGGPMKYLRFHYECIFAVTQQSGRALHRTHGTRAATDKI